MQTATIWQPFHYDGLIVEAGRPWTNYFVDFHPRFDFELVDKIPIKSPEVTFLLFYIGKIITPQTSDNFVAIDVISSILFMGLSTLCTLLSSTVCHRSL